MPGGKRRALKKLLKQQEFDAAPPPPSGSALDFIEFDGDEREGQPPADVDGAAAEEGAEPTLASASEDSKPSTSSVSASASAPESQASTPRNDLFGRSERGGKKSSKQRFAERQVGLFYPYFISDHTLGTQTAGSH
jgi:hypothetical protein